MKKKDKDYSNKIDVILYGNETIGSAERSTDKEEMKNACATLQDCFLSVLHLPVARLTVNARIECSYWPSW